MQQLIEFHKVSIDGKSYQQTVDARALHAKLEVGKDFSSWIKAQIQRTRLVEFKDYLKLTQKGELSTTGQTVIDYFLSVEASKHIAMMSGTDKGFEVRDYFLECERRALSALPAFALPDFTNPAAAARAWADAMEASQTLAIERDHAIATKAHIGDKRQATAMATASHLKRENNKLKDELGFNTRHATVIAVEGASGKKFGKQDWRPLKAWCKANGASSVTVPCARYGKAQAWPSGAWGAVYGVDLVELFGEVVA